MRVLVSTGIFPNAVEHTRGIYIFKQVEALRRRCEVSVIAPIPKYPPGLGRRDDHLPAESDFDGLRVYHPRYHVLPGLRFLHGTSVANSTMECHRRVIEAMSPDVILSFFVYPYGYAASLIATRFDLPLVLGTLGSDVNVKARRRSEGRMVRRALARSARVISVSRALDRAVHALGVEEARLRVIPNGVDVERFRPMDMTAARRTLGLDEGPLLCCVSRLSREKGIDILLHAVARMQNTAARVVVVGDGSEGRALHHLAAELGVVDRVDFVGVKPHTEIPQWIAAAQVSVLPSRIEGHPNAVVEAMACGRPVVAARVGGVPEAISSDDAGIMVPPEDPGALAAALDDALAREWDTERIAELGGRRTWDDVAEELMDVFAAVVENGPRT